MAYAAARMAESALLGLNGEPNIYECSFVQSDVSENTHTHTHTCAQTQEKMHQAPMHDRFAAPTSSVAASLVGGYKGGWRCQPAGRQSEMQAAT